MTLISFEDRFAGEMPTRETPSTFGSAKLRRETTRVVIRLADGAQVEGLIHIQPMSRPLDLLNQRDSDFIAVTDVRLYEDGELGRTMPFLAVSKGQIVRMYEAGEP